MDRQTLPHQLAPDQRRAFPAPGFFALIVLLIAGLAGASGYVLGARPPRTTSTVPAPSIAPTQSPASLIASSMCAPSTEHGWRTYSNETYGYTLRFPEGWRSSESYLDTTVAGVRVVHALDLGPASRGGYASGAPLVLLRVMASNGSTAALARAFISSSGRVTKTGSIQVNGIAGERWSATQGHGGEALFFVRHGWRYVLITEGQVATDDVVQSFRFDAD